MLTTYWHSDIDTTVSTHQGGNTSASASIKPSWTFPGTRGAHTGFLLPGYPNKYFIFGGELDQNVNATYQRTSDLYVYDVTNNTFAVLRGDPYRDTPAVYAGDDTFPDGAYYSVAAAVNNDTAILGFGSNATYHTNNKVWLYHYPTNKYMFVGM
jgi:hypothetical protein